MTSYTQPHFDQIKARHLSQFVSEMIDSWQENSSRCSLQYERINCVAMATYWVPDLPNVRDFPGFFWCSILIFFSDALFARFSKHINLFKVDYLFWFNFFGLKSTKYWKQLGGLEKRALKWKQNLIYLCVTLGTLSVSSFNGFWRKLIEIAPFI